MTALRKTCTLTAILACGGLAACTADSPLVSVISAEPVSDAPAAASAPAVAQPADLTGDEVIIWNSLRPESKQAAAEFIANGGTLTQFVSQ